MRDTIEAMIEARELGPVARDMNPREVLVQWIEANAIQSATEAHEVLTQAGINDSDARRALSFIAPWFMARIIDADRGAL